ncbi:fimbrial protein [Enterobacter sp. RIT418]|uniref:fimbrial protein n=1 Tax=Enterobacter sp. RIT418 TaxID=2202164 RepID=UPI000D416226|nr:fimbrial protein [Enterobacter sp. RIT 418]RAU36575.1 fimbrial protein [Enterobacter sp. RIT 418]
MKTVLHCLSYLIALYALAPAITHAHDGTVYINGKINEHTCTISLDSQKLIVKMGTEQNHFFTQAGDGGAYHPFAINLESCATSKDTLSITFEGTPDNANPSLLAITTEATSATGVAVGIFDINKTPIVLGDASASISLSGNDDTVTFHFFARYIATRSTVTTGTANAASTFILNYA